MRPCPSTGSTNARERPRPSRPSTRRTVECTSAPTTTVTGGAPCSPSSSTFQPARASTACRAAASAVKLAIVAPTTKAPPLPAREVQRVERPAQRRRLDRRRRRRHHVERAVLIPGRGQPVRGDGHRQRTAVDEAEVAAAGHRDRGRRAEPVDLIEDVDAGRGRGRAARRRSRPAPAVGGGLGGDAAIGGGFAVADAAVGGVEEQSGGGKRFRAGLRVALSCFCMRESNSVATVLQALRSEARRLAAGSRLPSVRALMARHRVSPGTVRQAMARLADEGVLEARPGHGTFLAPRPVRAAAGRRLRLAGDRARRRPHHRRRRGGAAGRGAGRRRQPRRRLSGRRPAGRRSGLASAGPGGAPARGVGTHAARGHRRACAPGSPASSGPRSPRARSSSVRDRRRRSPRRSTRWPNRGRRCWSSRRPTSARWSRPGPPACAWCRYPPTPTASCPSCWPARSTRPGRARLLHRSRCTPTRAARRWPPARRQQVLDIVAAHRALLIEDDWCRDLHLREGAAAAAHLPTIGTATASTCAR